MPVRYFNTENHEFEPIAQAFAKHFADPCIQEQVRKQMPEKGFLDAILVDYPESNHMVAGIGKLETGAGIPISERPLMCDEVVYVIEGSMTCTSEGQRSYRKSGRIPIC